MKRAILFLLNFIGRQIFRRGLLIFYIWFMSFNYFIGGVASLGKLADGHYYVREKAEYHPFSRLIYYLSLWQERVMIVTIPILFVSGYLEDRKKGPIRRLYEATATSGTRKKVPNTKSCGR
jgi:hypothetical protein